MLTLIQNGEVYTPEPKGRQSVLLSYDRIAKIGTIDARSVEALGLELEIIDATGCVVTPGFIDPHEHLLGGSGEEGFSTQTPEIPASEIVRAGITTVVGCLGVDTTMKTMAGLLAKAKGLKEEGLNAFIWSGGYNVPPTTVLGSIREDIMFIDEVIGAGEIAIADHRSLDPDPQALAKLISDAHVGGMLSRKAGVTHFHVGEADERLSVIRKILDEYELPIGCIYLTHIERSTELIDEAIELANRGAWVDMDTVDQKLEKWLSYYLEHGGDPTRITVSSDASKTSPGTLTQQICSLVTDHGRALEDVLPLVTSNTARVLRLDGSKGTLEPDRIADLLVLRKDSLEIVEVISRGRRLVRDGAVTFRENFLDGSNREIHLVGTK
jgi:beta-aspartyl-dipeptidase (metallo-type)